MITTRIKIAKLSGATDAAQLEKALEAMPRVHAVSFEQEANSAVIEHDGADPKELTEAIKRLGYPAAVD